MTEEKVPGSKYVNVFADNIIIIIIITQFSCLLTIPKASCKVSTSKEANKANTHNIRQNIIQFNPFKCLPTASGV
jgi:hypothetical protein